MQRGSACTHGVLDGLVVTEEVEREFSKQRQVFRGVALACAAAQPTTDQTAQRYSRQRLPDIEWSAPEAIKMFAAMRAGNGGVCPTGAKQPAAYPAVDNHFRLAARARRRVPKETGIHGRQLEAATLVPRRSSGFSHPVGTGTSIKAGFGLPAEAHEIPSTVAGTARKKHDLDGLTFAGSQYCRIHFAKRIGRKFVQIDLTGRFMETHAVLRY